MADSAAQTLITAKTSKMNEIPKTSAGRSGGFIGHKLVLILMRLAPSLC